MDSFVPKPGLSKSTTLNKSQRKLVTEGSDTVMQQDTAMWSTLSSRASSLKKLLLVVAMVANQFTPAIGQLAEFVGVRGAGDEGRGQHS